MKEDQILSAEDTASLLKANKHMLYYLRYDDGVPYACVLAMQLPDKSIRCGWSLLSPKDEDDPTVFFEKQKARQIAVTRILENEDPIKTARAVGKKKGALTMIKYMKKAKGNLYLRANGKV